MNSLTETAMTPPQREEVEDLLRSTSGQIVRGIAVGRKLSETEVTALIDRGPLLADEALTARLIDRIGYRDEAVRRARERAGSGAELVSLSRYLDGAGRPHDSGPTIALIYGTGSHHRRRRHANPASRQCRTQRARARSRLPPGRGRP